MKMKNSFCGLLALAASAGAVCPAVPVYAQEAAVISLEDSGWHKENNLWFYIDEDGVRLTDTKALINGEHYFFDKDGWMMTGWIKVDDNWYFAASSGAMKTGWIKDGNTWYYTSEEGIMQTGWLEDGGKTYFLGKSGAMKTGWALLEDAWYYFDNSGAMQTGWIKDGSTWYYTNEKGIMQTGWIDDGGYKYYLSSNGAMKTGWARINSEWYFFQNSGAMKTGWLKDKGLWYFLSLGDGHMLTDCWIEPDGDGVLYYLNADGVWTKTAEGIPSELLAYNPDKIGTLDTTPCSFLNYGWLSRVNGKYGVLGTDGAWVVPAKYSYLTYITNNDMLDMREKSGDYKGLIVDANGIREVEGDGYGGATGTRLVVTGNGQLKTINIYSNVLSNEVSQYYGDTRECYKAYPLNTDLSLNWDTFYYYAGGSEKLYGPYTANSSAIKYFGSDNALPNVNLLDFNVVYGGAFTGLFATKADNGSWTLNTPVSDKTAEGFTKVEFSSPSSAVCWKGNSYFEVYDLNMNLLHTSDSVPGIQLQNGSGVVNGRVMVEYLGDWYLIDNPGK